MDTTPTPIIAAAAASTPGSTTTTASSKAATAAIATPAATPAAAVAATPAATTTTSTVTSKSKPKSKSKAKTPAASAGATKKSSTAKKTKPRKKKTTKPKLGTNSNNNSTSATGSSSTSNPVMSAAALTKKAKNIYEKLMQEKEFTLHDEAWLSSSSSSRPNSSVNTAFSPSFLDQDVHIIQKALQNNGISPRDVSVEAFGCLLESARKYALEIIHDATDYSMLSSTEELTCADLKLAQEMYYESTGVIGGTMMGNNYNSMMMNSPEALHHLSQIADDVNKTILPPIPDECYNGIVLPPAQHNLLGRTFDIVVSNRGGRSGTHQHNSNGTKDSSQSVDVQQSTVVDASGDVVMSDNTNATAASTSNTNAEKEQDDNHKKSTLAYGANRGPQIEINLRPKES